MRALVSAQEVKFLGIYSIVGQGPSGDSKSTGYMFDIFPFSRFHSFEVYFSIWHSIKYLV